MGRFLPVSTYVFDLEEFTGMEALFTCRLYTQYTTTAPLYIMKEIGFSREVEQTVTSSLNI
jgi:hypothetical protein